MARIWTQTDSEFFCRLFKSRKCPFDHLLVDRIGNSEITRFSKTRTGDRQNSFRLKCFDKGHIIFNGSLWEEIESPLRFDHFVAKRG